MRILSICTDGISNKLVCGFQYSTRTEETIKAKKREVYGCKQSYIHIQYVRGDCSVYETAELRAKLRNYDQCVTFCGTGAHHTQCTYNMALFHRHGIVDICISSCCFIIEQFTNI